jgi:integrase
LVPLHPFLVKELNFIGYAKSLPDHTGRIFPETNRVANRYGHNFSMWFSQFRKRCLKNVKPRRKTFPSLRHTLKTHLAERGADVLYNHYLTGHTTKPIGDDYIKPKPKLIYEKAVLKIDWNLDLGHLKKASSFQGKNLKNICEIACASDTIGVPYCVIWAPGYPPRPPPGF